MRAIFCSTDEEVGALLDPLGMTGCNAHLVGMILDASIGAVVPVLLAAQGEMEGEDVVAMGLVEAEGDSLEKEKDEPG